MKKLRKVITDNKHVPDSFFFRINDVVITDHNIKGHDRFMVIDEFRWNIFNRDEGIWMAVMTEGGYYKFDDIELLFRNVTGNLPKKYHDGVEAPMVCPLGMWDMRTNEWYPNKRLKLSPDEQQAHNIKHGFFKNSQDSQGDGI